MSYHSYSVSLTEGQKANLARAFKNRSPMTIRLKNDQLKGNFPLLLTKTQTNRINKADKTGVDINISKKQISAQSKNGGFLGALASILARTVLPTVARIAPKGVAPLATCALSGLASTGVSKIFGNGLILPVPHPAKQQQLLNEAGSYLTNAQINQMLKSNKLKLTKKQSQDGEFLPLLLGALGAKRKGTSSGCATKAIQKGAASEKKKKKKKKTFAINQCPTLIL